MDETQQDSTTPAANGQPVEVVQNNILPSSKLKDSLPLEPARSASNPSTSSTTLQSLTDKALHFLSHSSNETLGACLVGLSATTYFIFGRVGLIFIGVAGGVVLHATWEGVRNDDRDESTKQAEKARRREAGIEVVKRVLEWRSSRRSEDEGKEPDKVLASSREGLDYSSFEPETAKALNYFTDTVIKDYVYWWYAPQLPGEESFPASCRRTFTAFILSLTAHLRRKRPADALLDFITNASSLLIVFLSELSAATSASPNSETSEAIAFYLQHKPDAPLSHILDSEAQDAKLREASEDILQAYLDPKAYNCEPVRVFLKEVLSQLVLGMTVTLCSRPEWINEWIVYGLEESETTREVMDLVDAGVEGRDDVPKREERGEVDEKVAEGGEHRRKVSAAEEAMDEAMREAKRLTQMMIEEDERRSREDSRQETGVAVSSSEDVSDAAATPTSSQSDRERRAGDEVVDPWKDAERSSGATDSTTLASQDSRPATPNATTNKQFTSFDQIVPPSQPTALSNETPTLALVNATISILDDSLPNEKPTTLKVKPTTEYLLQIEPANSSFPGWMIARKYTDFETLHEVLRRISVITGVTDFADLHMDLPRWKGNTRSQLRSELERYISDAVKEKPLAECEGMKRFLERERGGLDNLKEKPVANSGGAAPFKAFEKMGGDVIKGLSGVSKQGSKAVMGGGKAVFGGVAGLAGQVGTATGLSGVGGTGASSTKRGASGGSAGTGISRTSTSASSTAGANWDNWGAHRSQGSTTTLDGYANGNVGRQSQDSLAQRDGVRTPPNNRPQVGRHISASSVASLGTMALSRSSVELSRSTDATTMSPSTTISGVASPSRESIEDGNMKLPPRPGELPEDSLTSTKTITNNQAPPSSTPQTPSRTKQQRAKPPLTDTETTVAIELLFAIITELYTLSSAWNFRRTLLQAAKTYLLRPGNPHLTTIKTLLQASLLDTNLSDAGIAGHIYKLRENALPTEEELRIWERDYPEKTVEEKEELRVKARGLLVRRGMPVALQSVMGAAASGEALGRVFDGLQDPGVAKGLVAGLVGVGLRVVTD